MFENLVNQNVTKLLTSDIVNNNFPGAVLFCGNDCSGKLTAALEIDKIYSCQNIPKGKWSCTCNSCLRNKSLTGTNILLMGPRDCSLGISAAKKTFLKAYIEKAAYLTTTRFLFLRSIRKLTMRFSGILWKGDSNINKISLLLEDINDNLELLDFPRELPEYEMLEKICTNLEEKTNKLETEYLYDSIPVNQIRNMEDWARIKSDNGKKTVIIENADRMSDSVRNALLKILEEPPADCNFILLTSKRNAILPTILSRVRTYDFRERSIEQQSKIIELVYHEESQDKTISQYLEGFLPVPADKIENYAKEFYKSLISGAVPNIKELIKNCNSFEPRVELKLFLNDIQEIQKSILNTQAGTEAAFETSKILRQLWENVTLYNQSIVSAFEIFVRDLNKINVTHGRVLCAGM